MNAHKKEIGSEFARPTDHEKGLYYSHYVN